MCHRGCTCVCARLPMNWQASISLERYRVTVTIRVPTSRAERDGTRCRNTWTLVLSVPLILVVSLVTISPLLLWHADTVEGRQRGTEALSRANPGAVTLSRFGEKYIFSCVSGVVELLHLAFSRFAQTYDSRMADIYLFMHLFNAETQLHKKLINEWYFCNLRILFESSSALISCWFICIHHPAYSTDQFSLRCYKFLALTSGFPHWRIYKFPF